MKIFIEKQAFLEGYFFEKRAQEAVKESPEIENAKAQAQAQYEKLESDYQKEQLRRQNATKQLEAKIEEQAQAIKNTEMARAREFEKFRKDTGISERLIG